MALITQGGQTYATGQDVNPTITSKASTPTYSGSPASPSNVSVSAAIVTSKPGTLSTTPISLTQLNYMKSQGFTQVITDKQGNQLFAKPIQTPSGTQYITKPVSDINTARNIVSEGIQRGYLQQNAQGQVTPIANLPGGIKSAIDTSLARQGFALTDQGLNYVAGAPSTTSKTKPLSEFEKSIQFNAYGAFQPNNAPRSTVAVNNQGLLVSNSDYVFPSTIKKENTGFIGRSTEPNVTPPSLFNGEKVDLSKGVNIPILNKNYNVLGFSVNPQDYLFTPANFIAGTLQTAGQAANLPTNIGTGIAGVIGTTFGLSEGQAANLRNAGFGRTVQSAEAGVEIGALIGSTLLGGAILGKVAAPLEEGAASIFGLNTVAGRAANVVAVEGIRAGEGAAFQIGSNALSILNPYSTNKPASLFSGVGKAAFGAAVLSPVFGAATEAPVSKGTRGVEQIAPKIEKSSGFEMIPKTGGTGRPFDFQTPEPSTSIPKYKPTSTSEILSGEPLRIQRSEPNIKPTESGLGYRIEPSASTKTRSFFDVGEIQPTPKRALAAEAPRSNIPEPSISKPAAIDFVESIGRRRPVESVMSPTESGLGYRLVKGESSGSSLYDLPGLRETRSSSQTRGTQAKGVLETGVERGKGIGEPGFIKTEGTQIRRSQPNIEPTQAGIGFKIKATGESSQSSIYDLAGLERTGSPKKASGLLETGVKRGEGVGEPGFLKVKGETKTSGTQQLIERPDYGGYQILRGGKSIRPFDFEPTKTSSALDSLVRGAQPENLRETGLKVPKSPETFKPGQYQSQGSFTEVRQYTLGGEQTIALERPKVETKVKVKEGDIYSALKENPNVIDQFKNSINETLNFSRVYPTVSEQNKEKTRAYSTLQSREYQTRQGVYPTLQSKQVASSLFGIQTPKQTTTQEQTQSVQPIYSIFSITETSTKQTEQTKANDIFPSFNFPKGQVIGLPLLGLGGGGGGSGSATTPSGSRVSAKARNILEILATREKNTKVLVKSIGRPAPIKEFIKLKAPTKAELKAAKKGVRYFKL